MAHAAFHFAVGCAAGIVLATPRLAAAWQSRTGLAPAVSRWLAVSWVAGVLAIVPSLLRYAGVPAAFCVGWWMNIFALHPFINHHLPSLTIAGTTMFVGEFAAQYLVILAALARVRRTSGRG